MRPSGWIPLAIAAALCGCHASDIDQVKSFSLAENVAYTIGQAFGTRKVCATTNWTESTDDRGRQYVEYRCTIKGVDDYVSASSSEARKAFENAAQAEKDRYLDNLKVLQAGLADAKSALARAHGPAAAPTAATPMDAPSRAIAESLAVLQSGDIDAILARDYGPRYATFNRAVADYKAFKATPRMVTTYSRWGSRTTDGSDAAAMKFATARQAAAVAMSSDLAELQQRGQLESEQDLNYKIQSIPELQERIDRQTAGQQAAFAAIDTKLRTQLQSLASNPLTGVDELFQWTVSDRGYPVLTYSGLQMHFKDTTVQDREYQPDEREAAINAIIRDQAMSYAQFKLEQPAPVPTLQMMLPALTGARHRTQNAPFPQGGAPPAARDPRLQNTYP